uniref:Uncharacterized protein n=1 Tax=Rhizophora mucronata TaxID=61149 RepID=A0A2P2PL16_RHIMU
MLENDAAGDSYDDSQFQGGLGPMHELADFYFCS